MLALFVASAHHAEGIACELHHYHDTYMPPVGLVSDLRAMNATHVC